MQIAVLPGDDIGPEITEATLEVWRRVNTLFGLSFEFEIHEVGMASHRRNGTTLTDAVLKATREADGVLLGPGGMTAYPPLTDGGVNIPGTIRKQLELYANIRPARSRPGLPHAREGLDCVIVRENTEGFYADRNMYQGYGEFMPTEDCALSMRLITTRASRRIAERAFEIAEENGTSVTAVGKRHVLQISDGLFMRQVEDVSKRFNNILLREMDVDAMAAELYTRPEQFGVILTTNMFGDILSNLASALAGSLGFAAALNVGDAHAAANAGHGSAPDIAGKGIANPSGLILSSALLMRWLAKQHKNSLLNLAAHSIESALDRTIAQSGCRTRDIGGDMNTAEFGSAVADALREEPLPAAARY